MHFLMNWKNAKITLDNNNKYKYNGKGENKMEYVSLVEEVEDMSVYSVVVYYTGGSSRGYLIYAEDRNKLMEKLANVLDYNQITTVHIGEIFEVENMML